MYDISLFWIIVVGILNLITIIVFFVMASNVRKIKRAVCSEDTIMDDGFWNVVKEEIAIGNKEKAAELLKRAKFRCEVIKSQLASNGQNANGVNNRIERIERMLKELNS